MRSMIKYCTDTGSEAEIILLYSCHSPSEMIFVEDFKAMQRVNPRIKVVLTVTSPAGDWTGYTGRIDGVMVRREIPDIANRVFFVSGPQPMVEALVSVLKGLGMAEGRIRTELFTGYTT
jgi:ferredoxin-NADP reductase